MSFNHKHVLTLSQPDDNSNWDMTMEDGTHVPWHPKEVDVADGEIRSLPLK